MAKPESKRQRYAAQQQDMDLVKQSFVSHWREIADFIQPRRPRFLISDSNRGDRRNRNIIDSTATQCSDTLEAGMMSGLTSPSRRWFELTLADKDLADYEPVKEWLYREAVATSMMFSRSNLYQELPSVYGDCGDFATGAILVEEDYERVLSTMCIPLGSYMLGLSYRMRVEVFFRQFKLTVRQLVEQFGNAGRWDMFSKTIQKLWEEGNYNTPVSVGQFIEPNADYAPGRKQLGKKFKRFSSCYYELDSAEDRFLRESGYDEFPVMAPRWKTTGEDVYGTKCPGMVALGDVKQLQFMQKKKAQGREKEIDPPIQGPAQFGNTPTSILPGAYNAVDSQTGREGGLRPVHEVKPDIRGWVMDIQDIRMLIRGAYKTDLFRALLDTDRRQITAREVEEVHQEKISELSPVMERFNVDLLDPLVDMGFKLRIRQGRVSPPPPEIQGMELGVQYISILAQAQKALGIAGQDRFLNVLGTLAPLYPQTFDYVDVGKYLTSYGDAISLPPHIIRSEDEVQKIQAVRVKQQEQQQALEKAQALAKAGKDLSGADMQGDNALTRMISDARAGSLQPSLGAA